MTILIVLAVGYLVIGVAFAGIVALFSAFGNLGKPAMSPWAILIAVLFWPLFAILCRGRR